MFEQGPITVAQQLLGRTLYRRTREGICAGIIVETEAYLAADDSAAHSSGGINRKNASMFGPAGRAYVYTIHARQCFNVVTESSGTGSAVLVRAVQPVRGLELMHRRRRTDRARDLCRGPARLCEAFQIGRDLDGWNLGHGRRLWIGEGTCDGSAAVICTPRIGVTSAESLPLRFCLHGSEFVSGSRRQNQPVRKLRSPVGA